MGVRIIQKRPVPKDKGGTKMNVGRAATMLPSLRAAAIVQFRLFSLFWLSFLIIIMFFFFFIPRIAIFLVLLLR